LIIPAEEQSRELDAKLLLACVAAERGFPTIVGSRRDIHLEATRLPRGIYYAKSFRALSVRMFAILRDLGHEIVACDEEALLPYPDHLYFERRVAPKAYEMITNFFAWGAENAALFRRCPSYTGAPIHVTGNPRVDLMRREIRGYFEGDAAALRRRFGDFVLINTNFGTINHRVPELAWLSFIEVSEDGADSEDYKVATTHHRLALFSHFKELLPRLARAFPDHTIVLRPHPLENHGPWREAASGCDNVHVVHEGAVIPWLLAAKAVIQNNCTTAIESYLMERPVISYLPITSERLDSPITNALSYQAFGFEELSTLLRRIADGELGACDSPGQRKLIDRHIAALDGPLASDRIVDALGAVESSGARPPRPGAFRHARGWLDARFRALEKNVRSWIPGDKNNRGYQEQRFPGLSLDEVRERVDRFGGLLGRFAKLRIEQHSRNIYRITSD
jgi:surface carbohydrate biosynthesis protein